MTKTTWKSELGAGLPLILKLSLSLMDVLCVEASVVLHVYPLVVAGVWSACHRPSSFMLYYLSTRKTPVNSTGSYSFL